MRFEITAYDDTGNPCPPDVVDLATVREQLARAAAAGRRLHIRPHHPRPGQRLAAREERPRP